MKIQLIDLTHPISPEMTVYPGTDPPIFEIACSIDDKGFQENKITFFSHTGTHIDAPAHIIQKSKTLDMLKIENFYGEAVCVKIVQSKNQVVGIKDLLPYQNTIRQIDFLLIYTGWSRYWGTDKYFSDYPVLSTEAAKWLSQLGLKGIGCDTISVDNADTNGFPIHKAFLTNDTIIIENLTNLEKLPGDYFIFSCFPLYLKSADGSPVRAVAFLE